MKTARGKRVEIAWRRRGLAPADEPSFEPDPIKRIEGSTAWRDRFDDHRGHWTLPGQPIYRLVRAAEPLPGMLTFAMREFERHAEWLGAMFRCIALMLRLPGGSDFAFEFLPDHLDDRIPMYDRDLLFNVLERCLTLLVAEAASVRPDRLRRRDKSLIREIMSEVAGDRPHRPLLMSAELQAMLERLRANQLLNVIADCFDLLVMAPILLKQTRALTDDERRRGAGE